jgi:hypothetical protein
VNDHSSEFNLHNCSLSDCEIEELCGKPASTRQKVDSGRSYWYCAEHYDYMKKYCSPGWPQHN